MGDVVSGRLAMRALRNVGVEHLFTLSGGHIFPLYEGCRDEGVGIIDTRHEQTATFAAEGLAKLTRRPQVAALTAGPGVTNGVSAVAGAWFNASPMLVLGGRAPMATWGAGSLQEIDHVPFMAPLTKQAETSTAPEAVAGDVLDALHVAATPRRGPTFVDIPLDVIYAPADETSVPAWREPERIPVDEAALAQAAAAIGAAQRPVLLAGTGVWADGAWEALRGLVERLDAPVALNGMGRGCLPADHPLVISRARGQALKGADLVVVIGTPLDFRLGFGDFGGAEVVHIGEHPDALAGHVALTAGLSGDLDAALTALAERAGGPSGETAEVRARWRDELAAAEAAARDEESELLEGGATAPIHPGRVYGELRRVLERDAVVVGDGGDFVSYAGRYLDSYTPGRWLDPGPYGCLGTGPGYLAAARLAHPGAQVLGLLGDGAAGFSLMDVDTLVRHRLPAVMVLANNGIWALEKFPMQQLYEGWDTAADLRQETRYDRIVEALGGAGETVERADELGPALKRAFDAGVPYLVNVLTDPSVAYPRRAALA